MKNDGPPLWDLSVVERDNQLVGIITSRAVLLQLYPNYGDYVYAPYTAEILSGWKKGYADVLGKKVEEIMISNPLL